MAKKKTHEQFVYELEQINSNIEILGHYINSYTKIKCRCKIDGYEWEARPSDLTSHYTGCPKCGGRPQKNTETFKKELEDKKINIELIGKYINNYSPTQFRCKKCGYEWENTPGRILRSRSKMCPKCAVAAKTKTHEDFVEELKIKNPEVIVLEEYHNAITKIKCKCATCENEWYASPNKLLADRGCPFCKKSKGEKRINNFLTANNIQFEKEKTFDGLRGAYKNLRFDFWLGDYGLAIEYQGSQHSIPMKFQGSEQIFERQKKYDQLKKEYCKANGINLLEIWYYDFDNIEKILEKELKGKKDDI